MSFRVKLIVRPLSGDVEYRARTTIKTLWLITFSHIILCLVNSSWPVPVANEDWLLWLLCTLKILVAHFLTFAYACELVMVGRLWPLLLEELLLLVLFLHDFVWIQLFWFSHSGLSFHRSNLYFLSSCPFDFPDVSGL